MKTKQIISLFIAVALVMALAAGCEWTIGNRNTERNTGGLINLPNITEDIPEDEAGRRDFANRHGLDENMIITLPEGITEDVTEPPPPPLTTMPAGSKVEASEVYPLIKNVTDILNSGRFFLRGRLSADTGFGGGGPIVIARDGNKAMQESSIDWSLLAQNPGGGNDFGLSRVQAVTLTSIFGRKFRMVITTDDIILAFPDRGTFIDTKALGEASGDTEFEMPDDMSGFFDGMGIGGNREIPRDVDSSRVTVGGRAYLCATIGDDNGTVKYYFEGNNLRRMEVVSFEQDGSAFEVILEIDEFHGDPDAKLFTTQGMRPVPLPDIINMLSLMDGGLSNFLG